ncbi:amino acid permease [Exidia glandulosa HHB12029]|uniref:Amino acid permease n=1 Tax=Exidia glandulosa HHB12029 TaxID=1314781 RepID=A0A165MBT0_EXIGL|nr:amino acid permease [Exidia glandulosa HHB12029]
MSFEDSKEGVVVKDKHADADGAYVADTDARSVYSRQEDSGQKLVRQMNGRQITMIAIGGVIGTGLFVGTANALHNGGPLGMLLAYTIMGTVCFSVMISLGEMVAFMPFEGGHVRIAERVVEPAWGTTMGFFYCEHPCVIAVPAELSAAAVIFDYWTGSRINNAVYITVTLVLVVFLNFLGARWYGEAEFVFASIKIITIIGLIVLGIVLDLGGGPNHERIGFRYWKNPGPFAHEGGESRATGRFLGFVACLNQAAFSFIGTETIAFCAGETKDPQRTLPRAVRQVWIRIIVFYVIGTFIIGLLVPSNEPGLSLGASDARGSPFVLCNSIEDAGIKVLPSIINACLLTSAWSSASSDLYTSSRSIYGLARSGKIPAVFARTSRSGLPYVAIGFAAVFGLLGYLAVSETAGKVFGWLASLVAMSGLMCWVGVSVTYIRFHRGLAHQGIDRALLPYSSKFQPYAAWYALCACIFITLISGFTVFLRGHWDATTFVTNYLPAVLFPIIYLVSKVALKSKLVRPEDMDFSAALVALGDS